MIHQLQSESWARSNPRNFLTENKQLRSTANRGQNTRLTFRNSQSVSHIWINLRNQESDSRYDISPGGLSQSKLIWVPGQVGAFLQGGRSWQHWEAFDQRENQLRKGNGEEIMFVRQLMDGWAATWLDGIKRNHSNATLPLTSNKFFPTYMTGLGYLPGAWFTRLYVCWFLNGKGIHAKTWITLIYWYSYK